MIRGRVKANEDTGLRIVNSLTTDIQAAHQAGLRAVWVNRSGKSRDNSVKPDWEIASLDVLINILAKFR